MYMEILHKTCPDMLSPLYPLPFACPVHTPGAALVATGRRLFVACAIPCILDKVFLVFVVKNLKKKKRIPLPTILLANVQSLKNKVDELQANIRHLREYKNACILALTETWLTPQDTDSSLALDGFDSPVRLDRDNEVTGKNQGGGVYTSIEGGVQT